MAKKASKNSRVASRAANMGSGKDHVKVWKSGKNPGTGHYSFREQIVHKDKVKDFFAAK
jgi:Domain of unknown function (DUF4295)